MYEHHTHRHFRAAADFPEGSSWLEPEARTAAPSTTAAPSHASAQDPRKWCVAPRRQSEVINTDPASSLPKSLIHLDSCCGISFSMGPRGNLQDSGAFPFGRRDPSSTSRSHFRSAQTPIWHRRPRCPLNTGRPPSPLSPPLPPV